ncbi:MAG: ABC transporter substrate-binding protein [Pigmentiphaga sp.]|uniref:ABC transporter substrate-binding protein n=1 Tax=Pigmentiphaga sp. TaxID=1977564 RepID=UPI003B570F44
MTNTHTPANHPGLANDRLWTRRAVTCLLGATALLARQVHAQSGVPGVSDRQIALTGSVDLSGPASIQIKMGFSGSRLYFDQLNQRGGVHGRQVLLNFLDDGFDPHRTIANIEKVHAEGKTFAIFGTTGDEQSAAAIDICTRLGLPLFAPVCGAHGLRTLNRRKVYFVRASYRDEATKILRHATTVGHDRLVVAYQDDGFGKSMRGEVHAAAKQLNLPPPESIALSVKGVPSPAAAAQLARLAPSAVVLATIGEAFTNFVKDHVLGAQARPQIYGFSLMSPQIIAQHLGAQGRGMILAQFVPSIRRRSVPIVAEYLAAHLKSRAQEAPSTLALEGYVMAKVFAEGLRRAGRNLNREGLVAALDQFGSWDVGGMDIRYDESSRAGSSYVDLAVMNDKGDLVF